MKIQKYKTVWMSDFHLGCDSVNVKSLSKFLDSFECDNIYLVGDIIDNWKLKFNNNWTKESLSILRKIGNKSKKGTKIYYLPGNHDPEAIKEPYKSLLMKELNLTDIRNSFEYTTLKGKTFIIVHGQVFDPLYKVLKLPIFKPFILLFGKEKGGAKKVDEIYHLMINNWFTRRAVKYAKKHSFEGIITGHIHKPRIVKRKGVIYHNDGDWVYSFTALVENLDGTFEIINYDSEKP